MSVANYDRVNWEDAPSKETPLNADNLNNMDAGIEAVDEAVNNISERVSSFDNRMDLLDARMDTLVAIPPGSTTENSELLDIRLGVDGTSYGSAGAAVRGQIDDVKDSFQTEVTDLKADLNYTASILGTGYKKLSQCASDASGVLISNTSYDTEVYQVSPNSRVNITVDSYPCVITFYTQEPVSGSVSYNNSRTVINAQNFTQNVPDTCNWMGVRVTTATGYSAIDPKSPTIAQINKSITENSNNITANSDKITDLNAQYFHDFEFALYGWVSSGTNIPTVNTVVSRFRTATFYRYRKGETISVKWSGLLMFPIYCDKTGAGLGVVSSWVDSITFTEDCYCYLNFKSDDVASFANDLWKEYSYFVHMVDASRSIWNGKTWYAFGTSMSDINPDGVSGNNGTMGKWPLVVDELSGALRTNKAIGSGGIVPSAPHGGNVKANIMQCPYDVDLVTFECGLNDWGTIDLGTIGDKSNNTFIGNFTQCIEYLTYHTRAKIVFISMVPSTYTDYSTGTRRDVFFTNSYGKTYREYIDAMIKVCEYYGVEVIDAEGNAMSAGRRNKQTIRDTVHFTNLGGQIYGRYIWSKLKNILPMPVIPEALA